LRAFQEQAECESKECRASQSQAIAFEYEWKQHAERHEHGNIADKVKQALIRALVHCGGNFVKRDEIAPFDSLRDDAWISKAKL
jgi:hypothetical protein